MKRLLIITASLLIIGSLISGCQDKKEVKKIKTPVDTVTSSTQNGEDKNQGQVVTIPTPIDASASATMISPTGISTEERLAINHSFIGKPINMVKDDWLTNFAGGKESTISVKIGQAKFHTNSEAETYVELLGKSDKVTLVSNSMSVDYYAGTNILKRVIIGCFTGKRLEGSEVVKDYSNGKDNIILIIDYDKEGAPAVTSMFCSPDISAQKPMNNYYELKIK